jgi:hypothetical protein
MVELIKKTLNNFWHFGHLQKANGQLAPADAYITLLWLKILGNHNLENILY